MKYNISSLLKDHYCRVVFVSDPKDSIDIENAVYEHDIRFKHKQSSALNSAKGIGPFKVKNKTSIWDICKKTKGIKREGNEFLNLQMKNLDIVAYKWRVPGALSYLQRLRVSVLYDILHNADYYENNTYRLLLNDCYVPLDGKLVENKSKSPFFSIADFLSQYDDEVLSLEIYDFIWITDMSPAEFFKGLEDQERVLDLYRFYSAKDGVITQLDTEELENSIEKDEYSQSEDWGITSEDITNALRAKGIDVDAEIKAIDKAKQNGQARLRVIAVAKDEGIYGHMIYAHIESGGVKRYDRLVSLRTNTVYKPALTPVDITYDILKNLLSNPEALSSFGYSEQDLEYVGYNLDEIRNYVHTEEKLDVLSAIAKKISAGDSGPLTMVALDVLAYKSTVFYKEILDIEQNDVLIVDNFI